MKRSNGIAFIFLLVAIIGLSACSKDDSNQSKKQSFNIVTTFYPIKEFTEQVVGKQGTVTSLIGAGIEPHDYEPSAKDIARIMDADVFIYSSADMETWVPAVLKNIKGGKPRVIKASKELSLIKGTTEEAHEASELGESYHGDTHSTVHDPHVWLDPVNAKRMVVTIANGVSAANPTQKKTYMANKGTYLSKLNQLIDKFKTAFSTAKNKTFIVQHAAFGYLAKRYDLNQVSIAGLSPDEEPSPGRLAELKTYIDKHQLAIIYVEETDSAKIAETLAKEANVKTMQLNPLEGLTNAQQKAGENYISVMTANLKALQKTIK